MSGLAYEGYCYPALADAITAHSSEISESSEMVILIQGSNIVDSHNVNFTYAVMNLLTGTSSSRTIPVKFYDCPVIGPLASGQELTASYLSTIGIDSSTILYVYSWGMGAVLMMFALGYAIDAAQSIIKKV
jgi:hypothetical protein